MRNIFNFRISLFVTIAFVVLGAFSLKFSKPDFDGLSKKPREKLNNFDLKAPERPSKSPDSKDREMFIFHKILSDTSDSLSGTEDSLAAADTTEIDSMAIDSTARLKHFKYQREDKPYIRFSPEKKSAFFAQPSEKHWKREAKLDSTQKYVIIKESVAGQEIKHPLKIPIDQYIDMRLKEVNQKIWEDLAREYELKDAKKKLGDVLGNITNIDIPLPSVSFLSIFGPPKINLRINGAVDIHGAWRNETTEGLTASRLGNTRNEPDFSQQVQINVSGTIGDKLNISADWNTERTFEYENQLKIKYTGYDDEIIQSIEAGNVSLQTSSLVGGSEALFGVKARFQFGPLDLTTLASQKKGETEEVSVSGGSTKQDFTVRAYEYSQNHFFLNEKYADTTDLNLFENYYNNPVPQVNNRYFVKEVELWKSTTEQANPAVERNGNAFVNLEPRGDGYSVSKYKSNEIDEKTGRNVIGARFEPLEEGTDYEYHAETGFITLKTQIQDNQVLAAAFRREGPGSGNDDDVVYGEFLREVQDDTSETIVLTLIKPKNLQPKTGYEEAWELQLKNIYPIGGREVKREGFEMDIEYEVPGSENRNELNGVKLLRAFGLDNTDQSQSGGPDGAFDFIPGRHIFPASGEIIFPVLQPFGGNSPGSIPDSLKYQAIYDELVTNAKQDRSKDKFILTGQYSAASTSTYQIGFNVVENSVKVTLNGRELTPGTDYTVDYNIGEVRIRNESALAPGADLKISYEKNDLFALASKTLLGLRGVYNFSDETKLGFSFLNLNQNTLSDKVRIGEEPLNNSIFGVDFKTNVDLPFVTEGLDYLISTNANSNLSVQGEYAYINPNPNTKKSKVASDNDNSIAYIDDFEGAKRTIPLGVSYTNWKDLSPPDSLPVAKRSNKTGTDLKKELMNYKAHSYWYNILPSPIVVEDIWGDRKQVARENEKVTVLDMVYEPSKRGSFNYNPSLDTLSQNWGGMMKILSSTANNLEEENIEFIEFWAFVKEAPEGAKLNIDLGKISEDVIPNDSLDTEDKNRNDLIDEGEDTGIDGLTDVQERQRYSDLGDDPSNDNFAYSTGSGNFERINGTQGNAELTDIGRFPDSEDLNRNFTLDRANSYFRYEVPLDTNKAENPFIVGGGEPRNWYQFRIPLREFKKMVGAPSFTIVEYIRFFITGVEQPVHIKFAEMNLVGNQWEKSLTGNVTEDDSVLSVSTVNVEDNPGYYTPPGVVRERDRSKPDQNVLKNEQSLSLILNNLPDGQKREAVKYLFRPLDVFNYKEMKMFIHGDERVYEGSISNYIDEENYAAEIYFRFGTDSSNFYEYKQPIKPGWNEISLKFDELTAIKQRRTRQDSIFSIAVPGRPTDSIGIKGRPSLTNVSFFTVGIVNPKDKGTPSQMVSGNIWLNELRVLNADDSEGWAYSASTSMKFADLMDVNFNINEKNPFFHRLSDRFGSRVQQKNWGTSVNFKVLKLLPFDTEGSNLNINYSHNETVKNPLYLPNTDVKVDQAVSQLKQGMIDTGATEERAQYEADQLKSSTQTINISDTWSLSKIQFKIPSEAWYVKHTINSLSFGFNYNSSFGRNPSTEKNKRWVWNANANYSLNFGKDNFFYPANIPVFGTLLTLFKDYRNVKVHYIPQSFSSNVKTSRSRNFRLTRDENAEPSIQRDFTASRSANFKWTLTEGGFLNPELNYNVSVNSSLSHLLTGPNERERSSGEIWNDIISGSLFGRDRNYRQSVDFRLNPKLPSLWDIDRYFNINASYNVSYKWKNNFNQGELGKSGGFSNNIRARMKLRLQPLLGPLFQVEDEAGSGRNSRQNSARGRQGRDVDEAVSGQSEEKPTEGTQAVPDSVEVEDGVPIHFKILNALKKSIKYALIDYESINISFNQSNSVSGSGLKGSGSGFGNFWGITQQTERGPSRLFMLGLDYDLGPRAANGNLSDNFSQQNKIEFSTSRPLWENASIDLNWNVGWGINKSTSMETDENGNISITNQNTSGKLDRSFLTLPSFMFLPESGMIEVNKNYDQEAENSRDELSQAFIEGFESLPLLSKLPILKDFAKYVPRPNWRITWRGLEKFSFIESFAQSVSLSHGYNSSYSEGWQISPEGDKEIQTQRINYGFSPLIGVNFTFNKLWGGDMTASFKYGTRAGYNLGSSTQNITETFSKDINLTANYRKSGFEIPLFGVALKNDIEISLSYTSSTNSTVIYKVGKDFDEEGEPQDGTIRTTIEPRIRYVMSSRVTLSFFYKRTTVEPKGASRVPPTTTNEVGLDVSISIQ